ncbi:MAG: CvpA family protein [Pseudomonadota bacterium]
MPITLLDGILLLIMLVSAVLAMIRGFSREVLSIASWVAAAIAAFFLYGQLAPIIQENVGGVASNDVVANIAAAAVIFLITLILVSYLTMKVADFIIDSRIGPLDRTLGFVFGAVRGMLLVVVALMGFLWLAQDKQPEWITNAKSKEMLVTIGERIINALPENLEGTFLDRLRPKEKEEEAGDKA